MPKIFNRNDRVLMRFMLAWAVMCGSCISLHAEDSSAQGAGEKSGRLFHHERIITGSSRFSGQLPAPRAGGLTIIPTFDKSVTKQKRAADIMATINAAIANYQSKYSNPITVNINFTLNTQRGGLGASQTNYTSVTYSDYRAALVAHATTPLDAVALANLPPGSRNPVNGNTGMTLATALGRALGFQSDPPSGEPDGTIYLNFGIMNITSADTNPDKYSLYAVASHEIDEVLGFGSQLDSGTSGAIYPEDLFRYDETGTKSRSFTRDSAAVAFFSIDGISNIAQFNQDPNGDHSDWYSVNGGVFPQVQDAFGTPGGAPVPNVELRVLDVIGYTRVDGAPLNHPPVISSPASYSPNPAPVGGTTMLTVAATDPDNDLLSVAWDYGDGSQGNGASSPHVYSTEGIFIATATITDGFGGSITTTVQVTAALSIKSGTLTKKSFTLDFVKGNDSLDITMSAADFANVTDGTAVSIYIGDVTTPDAIQFDMATFSKGKAAGFSGGKFTLSRKSGTIRYSISKTDVQAVLSSFNVTSTTASGIVTIPLYIFVGSSYYGGNFNFSYTNTNGKLGKGK